MSRKLKALSEQVMIITGATSGIGLVTARMAADRGAKLVLAARNSDALEMLTDELRSQGVEAIHVTADVGDREAVARIGRAAINAFGRIDTWVNNAAVSVYGRLTEIAPEEHRRVIETNYWGYVHGCMEAVKHLRENGGAIICVGSVLGDRSIPMQGPYCASKHAVKGFLDSLRLELHEEDLPIAVTLIKPSAIDTPYKDHAKNYLPRAPKNPPPVYAPDAVARAILFCAEHERRDVVIGAAGKLVSIVGMNFSRLTDRVMGRIMSYLQMTENPPGPRDRHNLFEPRGKVLEERGYYPHYVAETSLYTQMRLRPWTTLAVAAAGGLSAAALWTALAARRQHGREQRSVRQRTHDLATGGLGIVVTGSGDRDQSQQAGAR